MPQALFFSRKPHLCAAYSQNQPKCPLKFLKGLLYYSILAQEPPYVIPGKLLFSLSSHTWAMWPGVTLSIQRKATPPSGDAAGTAKAFASAQEEIHDQHFSSLCTFLLFFMLTSCNGFADDFSSKHKWTITHILKILTEWPVWDSALWACKRKKWVPTFSCVKFREQFKYISISFAVQRADGGLNIF